MKQYKNSKGEDLPKEINEVVNAESKRLRAYENSDKLSHAFEWDSSNYFKENNDEYWQNVDSGDYLQFYLEYKFKNAKGQIFPDEIQNEIYEEIKAKGLVMSYVLKFESDRNSYWYKKMFESDYTPTEIPTKSDDTFTQGEIVEVRDSEGQKWAKREYVSEYKGCHICFNENTFFTKCVSWKEIRKIQPLELTLPELLTIAESVKGTKVKLKS